MKIDIRRRILQNNLNTNFILRRFYSSIETVHLDHVIVGGGVCGLAIAETLSRLHPLANVGMIERHPKFGFETSSRNSEVIHSGIYYPPGSLKSQLCIEGKHRLYEFCDRFQVPYSRIGKWIVAVGDEEVSRLDDLYERAKLLDIPTHFISQTQAALEEPNVKATKVLVSPTTGIIDSHTFMETLDSIATRNGTYLLYSTELIGACEASSGYELLVRPHRDKPFRIITQTLINAGGLGASNVASFLLGTKAPKLHYYKGRYYKYASSKKLVSRLIYPMPDHSLKTLGIHCTLDLDGNVKFGPSIEPAESDSDYSIEDKEYIIRDSFYESVKRYLRGIEKERLVPDYCGIRPKLSSHEEKGFKDFLIEQPVPGFINLMGIESPGLTSSLAIANHIHGLIYK